MIAIIIYTYSILCTYFINMHSHPFLRGPFREGPPKVPTIPHGQSAYCGPTSSESLSLHSWDIGTLIVDLGIPPPRIIYKSA